VQSRANILWWSRHLGHARRARQLTRDMAVPAWILVTPKNQGFADGGRQQAFEMDIVEGLIRAIRGSRQTLSQQPEEELKNQQDLRMKMQLKQKIHHQTVVRRR
jgi:hypothetical protein